jgi:nicotinamidase/pyrazinamidase
MKIDLVIIDAHKDFCARANPGLADVMQTHNNGITTPKIDFVRNGGSLFVPGADEDCVRLASMITRLERRISKIHVILDSHQEVDIAHPVFWRDSAGNNPAPFTIISRTDVESGTWTTSSPACLKRALEYVQELDDNGRFPLCIWPPHCIIGSEGHGLEDNVSDAIRAWSKNRFNTIDFVTKGSNLWTEHYSAIKADVPDPSDPTTLVNSGFVNTVDQADLILITGQALSHCVNNTVTDLIDEFGADSVKKIVLLRDTCSNVPGFENLGDEFITRASALGMQVDSSTAVLA